MTGQATGLYGVKFSANGTRTVSRYSQLWIIASDLETATRKAKRFLKSDGAVNIVIDEVVSHGTVDVF